MILNRAATKDPSDPPHTTAVTRAWVVAVLLCFAPGRALGDPDDPPLCDVDGVTGFCLSEQEVLDAAECYSDLRSEQIRVEGLTVRLADCKARATDFVEWSKQVRGIGPLAVPESERRTWWDRHAFGVGIGIGVVSTAALVFALGQIFTVQVAL